MIAHIAQVGPQRVQALMVENNCREPDQVVVRLSRDRIRVSILGSKPPSLDGCSAVQDERCIEIDVGEPVGTRELEARNYDPDAVGDAAQRLRAITRHSACASIATTINR